VEETILTEQSLESATTTVQPAVSSSTVSASTTASVKSKNTLTILPTEIGYLKIRSLPSTKGEVIGRAEVGATYVFQAKEGEWYQIVLPDASLGWVSQTYVKVVE
jgi:uncharacterized protein YgiM (DUF1202 family)